MKRFQGDNEPNWLPYVPKELKMLVGEKDDPYEPKVLFTDWLSKRFVSRPK